MDSRSWFGFSELASLLFLLRGIVRVVIFFEKAFAVVLRVCFPLCVRVVFPHNAELHNVSYTIIDSDFTNNNLAF